MKTVLHKCVFPCLAALLAACATTPQSRIKANQALFDGLPPAAQEKIKNGQVDIGFTEDMVLMAMDTPDRKYVRTTAAGGTSVWSYTTVRTKTERQRVPVSGTVPDGGGQWRSYNNWMWVNVEQQSEYERFRVEFKDGKVTAFEELAR